MKIKNKKHIVFLTPGFPESTADTTCIPALQLFINALNKRGIYKLSVIAFQYPYKKGLYSWNDIPVYSAGGANRSGMTKLRVWRNAVRTFKRINREGKIDHIHSFWLTECAYIGQKLAKRYRIPHSCTLMGQDARQSNKYLRKIKPFPLVITLSEFHSKYFNRNTGTEPDFVIPWGVEDIEFQPSKHKDLDVVGIGNLIDLKGFKEFILTIHEIKKQYPNIKAAVFGEGPQKNALIKLRDDLDLNGNITFAGQAERHELMQKLPRAKCILHLSSYESFGLIFPEALRAGVKIFASKVGIAPEIKEASIVENPNNAAKKIINFLNKDETIEPSVPYKIEHTVTQYIEHIFSSKNS